MSKAKEITKGSTLLATIRSEFPSSTAKDLESELHAMIDRAIESRIECGEYTITSHPSLPDGRKVIWIENAQGEGTTIDIERLFRWGFIKLNNVSKKKHPSDAVRHERRTEKVPKGHKRIH